LNPRETAVREERRQGGDEVHQEEGAREMANNFKGDMGGEIDERMRRLSEALLNQDLETTKWRLDVALGNMQGVEEEEQVIDLASPILKLLTQGRSNRICRAELFCPHQGCEAEIKTVSHLMTHLRTKHNTPREACADLIGFFVRTIMPQRISDELLKETGEDSGCVWDVERCHYPGCKYLQRNHQNVEVHIRQHEEMRRNIEALGWFWRTIRTIIEKKPGTTIKEVM
jgi:hypothetical protein